METVVRKLCLCSLGTSSWAFGGFVSIGQVMTLPACAKLQPIHVLVIKVTKLSEIIQIPQIPAELEFWGLLLCLWARRAGKLAMKHTHVCAHHEFIKWDIYVSHICVCNAWFLWLQLPLRWDATCHLPQKSTTSLRTWENEKDAGTICLQPVTVQQWSKGRSKQKWSSEMLNGFTGAKNPPVQPNSCFVPLSSLPQHPESHCGLC